MSARESARSPAVEDYCKAIFALEARTEQPVSTKALAERLGITPGSVSAMLKRLDELGLIEHVPYRGVRLTEDGPPVALEVIRHHRLLELFLAESLDMSWDRVHAEAEVLEHVLSEDLERADRREARRPHDRPARRPDPERRARAARARDASARPSAGGRRRTVRARLRLPIPRCCATSPSAASRRATASIVRRAPAVRRAAAGQLRRGRAPLRARDRRSARRRDACAAQDVARRPEDEREGVSA